MRRLYVVANLTGTAWWMSQEPDGRVMWTKKQLYATTFSSKYAADRTAKKYGGRRAEYAPAEPSCPLPTKGTEE